MVETVPHVFVGFWGIWEYPEQAGLQEFCAFLHASAHNQVGDRDGLRRLENRGELIARLRAVERLQRRLQHVLELFLIMMTQ